MLTRVVHDNGVVTYQSPLLRGAGVVHGFSTRLGGVSRGAYASLNLGPLAKDDATDFNTSIAENYRRLRRALGVDRLPRVECRQVHGGEVWRAGETLVRPEDAPCADAIVCDVPGRLVVIRTADCVPILLATRDGRTVAAVHAGWRGVVAQVVSHTIAATPGDLVAAIGPCISAAHFEVGDEVAEAFAAAGLAETVVRGAAAKPHIDLQRAVRVQLQRSGVTAIDAADLCTFRDADEFFSHRRDAGVTGRMAAVVCAAPTTAA
jgi:YfiH family protein